MNIGIMGGTFDPIHNGHLIVAQSIKERASLDEIWFMPASTPPHKKNEPVSDGAHRAAMVGEAISDEPCFRLCTLELELGGTSYTIDTVDALMVKYPEHRFYWIIGADMIAYLPRWHRIDELIERITFIGVNRPGYEQACDELPVTIRHAVKRVDAPLMELSSTEIRRRVHEQLSVCYFVPDPVVRYIRENSLYGS